MSFVKRRRRSLEVCSQNFTKSSDRVQYFTKKYISTTPREAPILSGSLTSRIKDALYTIFPELPSITSNLLPSEIWQWKSNPIVASCHNKLFKKIVVEEPTTFMSKILDRLFPSKKAPQNIRCIHYKRLWIYIKPVKSTNPSLRIRYQISYFKISTKSFE